MHRSADVKKKTTRDRMTGNHSGATQKKLKILLVEYYSAIGDVDRFLEDLEKIVKRRSRSRSLRKRRRSSCAAAREAWMARVRA